MTIEQFRNKAAQELNRTVEGLKAMLAQVEAPAPTKQKVSTKKRKQLSKASLHSKFKTN